MNKVKPPEFLVIPYIIIEDEHLTPADRIVYGVCYWFECMKDGRCFASNESIGDIAKIKEESVTNSLSRLENCGYVERLFTDTFGEREIRCLVKYRKPRTRTTPSDNGNPPLDNVSTPHQVMGETPLDNGHNKKRDKEKGIRSISEETSPELNKQIGELIDTFRLINNNYKNFYRNTSQRKYAKELIERNTLQKCINRVYLAKFCYGDKFFPHFVSPFELDKKWPKIQKYYETKKGERRFITDFEQFSSKMESERKPMKEMLKVNIAGRTLIINGEQT